MRRATYLGFVVALGCGLALTGCSSSGSPAPGSSAAETPTPTPSPVATSLPTIPEAFTLLPCPAYSPVNTLQIEGCAEHQILRLDREVSTRARLLFASLPVGAARAHLVAAQLDWVAYRRAACLSESDANAGGTLAPIDFADCEIRIDQERLTDLAAMQGELSP